ncbi:hypothetical protein CB1_001178004 [Camelus ferus]|nr:hypothetical protein CB1_001178004 [Camelus ferus]
MRCLRPCHYSWKVVSSDKRVLFGKLPSPLTHQWDLPVTEAHSIRYARPASPLSAAAAAPPPELPEWLRDLPREVCLCTSTVPGLAYGICAAQRIQQGTWIGPFQGVLLPPEKVQAGAVRNTQHLWENYVVSDVRDPSRMIRPFKTSSNSSCLEIQQQKGI